MIEGLPKEKLINRQLALFDKDRPLSSGGMARWATGDFFEDVTAAVTGAKRLRTDSRCKICPDLRQTENLFFESKACGKSAQVIVYECRMQKDRDWIQAAGTEIYYWLWSHDFAVTKATTINDLQAGLSAAVKSVIVVPSQIMFDLAFGRETRVVNSGALTRDGKRLGYGETNHGYGIGWTLRLNLIRERCRLLNRKLNVRVGVNQIRGLDVYLGHPDLSKLIPIRESQQELF